MSFALGPIYEYWLDYIQESRVSAAVRTSVEIVSVQIKYPLEILSDTYLLTALFNMLLSAVMIHARNGVAQTLLLDLWGFVKIGEVCEVLLPTVLSNFRVEWLRPFKYSVMLGKWYLADATLFCWGIEFAPTVDDNFCTELDQPILCRQVTSRCYANGHRNFLQLLIFISNAW